MALATSGLLCNGDAKGASSDKVSAENHADFEVELACPLIAEIHDDVIDKWHQKRALSIQVAELACATYLLHIC